MIPLSWSSLFLCWLIKDWLVGWLVFCGGEEQQTDGCSYCEHILKCTWLCSSDHEIAFNLHPMIEALLVLFLGFSPPNCMWLLLYKYWNFLDVLTVSTSGDFSLLDEEKCQFRWKKRVSVLEEFNLNCSRLERVVLITNYLLVVIEHKKLLVTITKTRLSFHFYLSVH